jgi:ABC-type uncharacterized transport system ATPase subunit
VGGYDIITRSEEIKQNIGYMSQKFSLYDDLTVEENINFYNGIYSVPLKKHSARTASLKWGLQDKRNTITGPCREVSNNGAWAVPFCTSRLCCFSTNPLPGSILCHAETSGI